MAILQVTGVTTDGTKVVSGVHILVGTHGLPLEDLMHFFAKHNIVVDWEDYVLHARKEGASNRTIRAKIEAAGSEIYRHEEYDEFVSKLDLLLKIYS